MYIFEDDSGFTSDTTAVYMCNTVAEAHDSALLLSGAQAVREAWDQSEVDCSGQDVAPLSTLSEGWWDVLATEAAVRIGRYGPVGAGKTARKSLAADTVGLEVLRAYDSSDWDRAAECGLAYLGDRTGRWLCR